jgi:hypothetical protein
MAWNEEVQSESGLSTVDAIVDDIKTAIETASAVTIGLTTLNAANDTVAAGYYEATTLSAVDTDLVVGNIKHGVNIFGKVGTYDTEAVVPIAATTVLIGKKGRVNGTTITGTMPNNAGDVAAVSAHMGLTTNLHVVPTEGYTDGSDDAIVVDLAVVDADLATGNIKAGITLLGVAGKTEVVDTVEAGNPVIAARMKTGDVAFVNGSKVTGNGTKTLSDANDTVAAGYYEGTTLSAVDTDLTVSNIAVGVTVFGFVGEYTSGGEVKSTGTITTSGDGAEAGNTILIDAKTYTFVDPIGVAEGNVLVGATPADSLDNLKAAINKGTGGGTLYVCAAAHPTVEATTNSDTVQTLQALTAGHAGNVALVATADHLVASAATLEGGLSAAVAGDIKVGHFAWVNGVKLEGTLP